MGALTGAWSVGDVPADCRSLAKAVGEFIDEVEDWEARDNINALYPPNSFWRALEAVRKARQAGPDKPRAPLESMQELRRQNVPDWQIARIYGLVPKEHLDRGHGRHLARLSVQRRLAANNRVPPRSNGGSGLAVATP